MLSENSEINLSPTLSFTRLTLIEGYQMRMRNFLALLGILLITGPAFADTDRVTQDALSALGLGDLQSISDTDGMEIRGKASAFSMVRGTTTIFGQLTTPDTQNFVVGSDVNTVHGNAENTNAAATATSAKDHLSVMGMTLGPISNNGNQIYLGNIIGSVGSAGISQGGFVALIIP
ncbi:MAG: hypothetical protein CMJ81_21130 [Planctomycetaceae bacterium]|jgi:hypothetical protein|nr:hypothetical protein [Planctomycetaceae bacterium]